jgi:hypothetical protein
MPQRVFDAHCYFPLLLYMTGLDGRQRLLGALLRPGNKNGTEGLDTLLKWAVRLLRARFPDAHIVLRGDSGFGTATMLRWCHALRIGYRLCVAQNPRLQALSIPVQLDAALLATFPVAGEDGQEFGECRYQAGTWRQAERVIVKAEVTQDKLNPRFMVTSEAETPETNYRQYCARGDRENRIKEFKLDLASGRASCHRFWAYQCRLLLHQAAYVLISVVQTALDGTAWAAAQVGTVRTRLLKIDARVVESCRQVWPHLPTSCPVQVIWALLGQLLYCADGDRAITGDAWTGGGGSRGSRTPAGRSVALETSWDGWHRGLAGHEGPHGRRWPTKNGPGDREKPVIRPGQRAHEYFGLALPAFACKPRRPWTA